jgi:hypothetical protein
VNRGQPEETLSHYFIPAIQATTQQNAHSVALKDESNQFPNESTIHFDLRETPHNVVLHAVFFFARQVGEHTHPGQHTVVGHGPMVSGDSRGNTLCLRSLR